MGVPDLQQTEALQSVMSVRSREQHSEKKGDTKEFGSSIAPHKQIQLKSQAHPATKLGPAAQEEKSVEKAPDLQQTEVHKSVMSARKEEQHIEKKGDAKELGSSFAPTKPQAADKTKDPVIQNLEATREQLSKRFGVHDPIIAALDGKIKLIAAGNDAKNPLIHEMWSTREKLREQFGADDPIVAALDSKIRLARGDVDASAPAQQGMISKDSKLVIKIDGHQEIDYKQSGKKKTL